MNKKTSDDLLYLRFLQSKQKETEAHSKDILRKFDKAFAKRNKDKNKYLFLFELLDVNAEEGLDNPPIKNNISDIVVAIESFVSRFMSNVFPYRKEGNFALKANESTVKKFFSLYTEPPEEVVEYVGEENVSLFQDDRKKSEIYNEVEAKLNELLGIITRMLHEKFHDSGFYGIFSDLVKKWLISEWDCCITRDVATGELALESPAPFSIAYDYDYRNKLIGVYRKIQIRACDVKEVYPDALFTVPYVDDWEVKNFKECTLRSFVKNAEGKREIWEYCVFDEKGALLVFRLLSQNPHIVFSDKLLPGSGIGKGRLFVLWNEIHLVNEQQGWLDFNVLANADPIREIDIQRLVAAPGSADSGVKAKIELKHGDVIKTNGHGLLMNVPAVDVTELKQQVELKKVFIKQALLGAAMDWDHRETATMTQQKAAASAIFAQAVGEGVVEELIRSMVEHFTNCMIEDGTLFNFIYMHMNIPNNLFPRWLGILWDFCLQQEDDAGKDFCMEQVNNFVQSYINLIDGFKLFPLEIYSPIAIQQAVERAGSSMAFLGNIANLLQVPPSLLVDVEKFILSVAKSSGFDAGLLLTKEERDEKIAASSAANNAQAEVVNR